MIKINSLISFEADVPRAFLVFQINVFLQKSKIQKKFSNKFLSFHFKITEIRSQRWF